jgi:hypothetical protein
MSANNYYLSGPWNHCAAVTPHNTNTFPESVLFVTTGGTLTVVTVKDVEVQVTVPNNFHLNCLVKAVKATGTAASGIIRFGQS